MDNVTNIPTQYGMLLSSATGDQMRAQLFFSTTGSLFRRKYSNNSWTNWFTMYDENILTNSTLLSPLASALGGIVGTITNLSELKGKTGKYMYTSKNSESPIANDSTCLVESLSAGANYTTIRIWHVANPQNSYTGLMGSNGAVATWNQNYNTSLLTNSTLLSPLASALGARENFVNNTGSTKYIKINAPATSSVNNAVIIHYDESYIVGTSSTIGMIQIGKYGSGDNITALRYLKFYNSLGNDYIPKYKDSYAYIAVGAWCSIGLRVSTIMNFAPTFEMVNTLPDGCTNATELT